MNYNCFGLIWPSTKTKVVACVLALVPKLSVTV